MAGAQRGAGRSFFVSSILLEGSESDGALYFERRVGRGRPFGGRRQSAPHAELGARSLVGTRALDSSPSPCLDAPLPEEVGQRNPLEGSASPTEDAQVR